MVNKRKICVVTGTRAEYGLFQLLKGLKKDKLFDLKLIVKVCISIKFGLTYKEIIKDGFKIDKKIEMIVSGDTPSEISKSVGIGFIGFSEAYKDIKPDLIIVFGIDMSFSSIVYCKYFWNCQLSYSWRRKYRRFNR